MLLDTLVLRKFEISRSGSADVLIYVVGRKSGFIYYILTIIGLSPTTSLMCTRDRVEYKWSGLKGEESLTIPLNHVTGIVGGYTKPIQLLILAGVAFLGGLDQFLTQKSGLGFLILGVIVPIILIVQYSYDKTMRIGVQNGGDKVYGLQFKKALIEGVSVDIKLVQEAIALLNNAVLASTSNNRQA